MAIKDVKRYYALISAQYAEMIQNIKDLEQEVATGLVEPERIERLREQVAPIKTNYERWAYMMFLLIVYMMSLSIKGNGIISAFTRK